MFFASQSRLKKSGTTFAVVVVTLGISSVLYEVGCHIDKRDRKVSGRSNNTIVW